ncbi:hypothetical protein LCGC14_1806500, partial [marine sediment metagenome]
VSRTILVILSFGGSGTYSYLRLLSHFRQKHHSGCHILRALILFLSPACKSNLRINSSSSPSNLSRFQYLKASGLSATLLVTPRQVFQNFSKPAVYLVFIIIFCCRGLEGHFKACSISSTHPFKSFANCGFTLRILAA